MRNACALILVIFCLSRPAMADQTDPRLDLLFEELRTGDAVRSEENVARIVDIWSTSQSDTVNILYERAFESRDEGANELALALLDHVVGLAPNFAQGRAFRGMVKLATGDREGAIEDFSKTLELEPRQFEVRSVLADILYSSGELFDAYQMYQKVLEWNPHDERARARSRELRRDIDGQEI